MQLVSIFLFNLSFILHTTITTQDEHPLKWEQQVLAMPPVKCIAEFAHNNLTVFMNTIIRPTLDIKVLNYINDLDNLSFHVKSNNTRLANVDQQHVISGHEIDTINSIWHGNITIDIFFMGKARIQIDMFDSIDNITRPCENYLELIIVRKTRIIDHVFTGSVALLVMLLYIIFGAALDINVLKSLLRRPTGPAIGFVAQFILMPLLSYGLGLLIFPDSVDMQLGLFFTGVSPSGGASNMWSVLLGGNITLSLLMTTISNFAAFGMMPLWIFTLGSTIFAHNNLAVPYKSITIFALSLVIPLAIGLIVQKCSQRATHYLIRLLKPASSCLILFIVIFAIATNLYLFDLFSWQIILGGILLPWLGYAFAWLMARMLHQNAVDALTIAIETGIQNTGIAIFLLRFSLPPPQDDLTTVIPVSVAIMTPLPLLGIYIYKRITNKTTVIAVKSKDNLSDDNVSSSAERSSNTCIKEHQNIL